MMSETYWLSFLKLFLSTQFTTGKSQGKIHSNLLQANKTIDIRYRISDNFALNVFLLKIFLSCVIAYIYVLMILKWDKVFENGPRKICGRQP